MNWKAIPSAPGYFASDAGLIKKASGKILRQNPSGRYATVTIFRDRVPKKHYVHALVCEAFHGPRPSARHQVAHNDGSRRNNAAKNLRWATPAENHEDKKAHGTWPMGEINARAILTEAQAAEIRRIYAANMGPRYVKRGTREDLARRFGVSITCIKDIVAGKSWKHVVFDRPFGLPNDDAQLEKV